jgi:hypothetical protein
MQDETQVVLVDAEPECIRGDDGGNVAIHECVLGCLAIRGTHLAVIQADGEAVLE